RWSRRWMMPAYLPACRTPPARSSATTSSTISVISWTRNSPLRSSDSSMYRMPKTILKIKTVCPRCRLMTLSGGCTRLSKRWWTKATTSRAYSENYINIVESIEQTAEAVFFLWRKFCPAARTPPGRRVFIFKKEPGSPQTKIKDRHNVTVFRYSIIYLAYAECNLSVAAHLIFVPRRVPDDVHFCVFYFRQFCERLLNAVNDLRSHRTAH